jgi:uncharacterized protein (TIGR03790 family)
MNHCPATQPISKSQARLRALASSCLILFFLTQSSPALEPDEIVLIVNKNVPESRNLADFYVNARLIPKDHILELALPGWDEIPFDTYERTVVPTIRDFLRQKKLDKKTTCLVTFYGVPLRVAARAPTVGERE